MDREVAKLTKDVCLLITGVNGGVGSSVYRAAMQFLSPHQVYLGDINRNSYLSLKSEQFVTIPKVEENNALNHLLQIINRYDINLIIPGSELEINFFAENKLRLESSAPVKILVSNLDSIVTCNNKWNTYQFFKRNSLRFPKTMKFEEHSIDTILKEVGLPLVVKPEEGTSSKHVVVCQSKEEVKLASAAVRSSLAQQLLVASDSSMGELTCGLFKNRQNKIYGPVCARRILRNGSSWILQMVPPKPFEAYLIEIAKCLSFEGPLNIQIKDTLDGPVAFELNCRFSGSTSVRAAFGYNDVRSWVLESLGVSYKAPYKFMPGIAVRHLEESYLHDHHSDDIQW